MNNFGGNWTKQKIEIIESYAKAYLKVMKNKTFWKLMYFDGFAGTGEINTSNDDYNIIEGAAKKILNIDSPRPFDMYYFVELQQTKQEQLKKMISENYPFKKNAHVSQADCNDKLQNLSAFLKSKEGRNYKVLAFIDPCGMELKWSSLENLKGHDVDLWILVPTGVGANRLLKRNGKISDAWLNKLEIFLGISKDEIMDRFYNQYQTNTLFGIEDVIEKERNSIEKIHKLYKERLQTIFSFVSDSFVLKNSTNSIMFHFLMATNSEIALKIANDIIRPKYRL